MVMMKGYLMLASYNLAVNSKKEECLAEIRAKHNLFESQIQSTRLLTHLQKFIVFIIPQHKEPVDAEKFSSREDESVVEVACKGK